MSGANQRRLGRKALVALAVVGAGITGLAAGTVGGAAGAIYVLETMARPEFSPKIKNAVVEYDMPKMGARPIDILGIHKISTPLNPCLIGFLNRQRDLLPHGEWERVKIHPYFKVEGDIITEMAFAKGYLAITRGNEITVRVLGSNENRRSISEILMFHELVHVDQYASGKMDLPDYAASAATAYARGERLEENVFEEEAKSKADDLFVRWVLSPERKRCHPDIVEEDRRAPSEKPTVKYAIYDYKTQQYQLVDYTYDDGG